MPDRPTILFVATPAALGGSNRSLVTLLTSLEGRVHRVLAAPPAGTFADLVRRDGLADEFLPLPRRPGHPLDRVIRLTAAARIAWWAVRNRRRLTAIHANALTGLNLAAPAAILTRRRTVVWIHDPVGSRWGARLGPMLRRVLPDLQIAAVSPTAESVAVVNGLSATGDASIIANPIAPNEVLATAHRSGEPPLHIGFVGGATHRKGFDLLPAVVRALTDLPVVWKLYVFLEPNQENAPIWEELATFPPHLVDPVGKTPDVAGLYGDLDIVFCPSRAESFCRVVAEAMMNGIAVAGSDIPPLLRLLGDDEAGLVFPSGDAVAAARAIRRLVEDPGLRRRLGAEGRRRSSEFAPEAIADALFDLYTRTVPPLPPVPHP